MDEQKKLKTKKILNIVVNVLVGVILVLALIVTINNIASSKKGYTSIFGSAYVVVQSDSMDAEKPAEYADKLNGFKKGDLLRIKILKGEDRYKLEEGDIISFYFYRDNQLAINSHRIVEITPKVDENGNQYVVYTTRGDNHGGNLGKTEVIDSRELDSDHLNYTLIGVVKRNAGGIGKMFDFFSSSTGFLVCIVIPSFLVVLYFAYMLIWEIVKAKKVGAAEQNELAKQQAKEELLAQLRAEGRLTDDVPPADDKPTEEENK